MPYSPFKFQSMKHLHIGHVGEQATLAVVIAVLYFCAISMFCYVFNLLLSFKINSSTITPARSGVFFGGF